MKWTVFFVVMLILLLPQPLFFSYTQSSGDYSVKLVESTNYRLTSSNGYADVNVSEAKQMIEANPSLVILDVRTQEEYDEGHIEEAVLIPVNELEQRIGELDREKETLVYCKSGVRSATASQILVDNGFSSVYNMLGGITAWRDAGYWIEIIHEGDLIIDGTQTYVIENCTYVQTGNIYVRDYGKLIVRDAMFIANLTYKWEYGASMDGHSSLDVENSEMTSYGAPLGIETRDFSKIIIKNARFEWDLMLGEQSVTILNSTLNFLGWGNSYVSVANSTIETIGIDFSFFNTQRIVTIDDLKPKRYLTWKFTRDACYLVLENTTVNGWLLNLFWDSIVTVTNSKLYTVALHFFENSVAEIDGLRSPGEYVFWNLQTNESVTNVNYDLTLENTSVEHWTICGCSQMSIANTTAHICADGQGKVNVDHSSVDCFHFCDYAEGTTTNSRIDGLLFERFHGSVFFDDTEVILGSCEVLNSDFCLSGDFAFILGDVRVVFVSSSITRDFNVIAQNASHNPVEKVELILLDENESVVWNGMTDGLGKTNFNLTFTDNNYTDTLRLEAIKGNYSAIMNVGFLSDTPVVLTMRYFADLNGDGTVNIMDIALVARAYGAKPGDPNWNETVDIVEPYGEINILDIATVAKHYGEELD